MLPFHLSKVSCFDLGGCERCSPKTWSFAAPLGTSVFHHWRKCLVAGLQEGQATASQTSDKLKGCCDYLWLFPSFLWMEHNSSIFSFLILRWLEINMFPFFFPKDDLNQFSSELEISAILGTTGTNVQLGYVDWWLNLQFSVHVGHGFPLLRAPFDLVKVEERMTTFCEALSSQAKRLWLMREIQRNQVSDVLQPNQ